ncbi:uncharacterized protein LOC134444603 [Engraulis encrasicolus]|uniref:uncharacterized protein LOC134444603 n=1 Tax=Engraulis encrasicolus TaxID=184585 RepID=UPI002FD20B1D
MASSSVRPVEGVLTEALTYRSPRAQVKLAMVKTSLRNNSLEPDPIQITTEQWPEWNNMEPIRMRRNPEMALVRKTEERCSIRDIKQLAPVRKTQEHGSTKENFDLMTYMRRNPEVAIRRKTAERCSMRETKEPAHLMKTSELGSTKQDVDLTTHLRKNPEGAVRRNTAERSSMRETHVRKTSELGSKNLDPMTHFRKNPEGAVMRNTAERCSKREVREPPNVKNTLNHGSMVESVDNMTNLRRNPEGAVMRKTAERCSMREMKDLLVPVRRPLEHGVMKENAAPPPVKEHSEEKQPSPMRKKPDSVPRKKKRKIHPSGFRGKGQLKLTVSPEDGRLFVHIMQARGLLGKRYRPCDSYVKLSVVPDVDHSRRWRTKTVLDSKTPTFNETFVLELGAEDHHKRLLVSMWNRSRTCRRSDLLGCMSFGVRSLLTAQKDVRGWYYLLGEELGRSKHLKVAARRIRKPADSAAAAAVAAGGAHHAGGAPDTLGSSSSGSGSSSSTGSSTVENMQSLSPQGQMVNGEDDGGGREGTRDGRNKRRGWGNG